MTLVANRLAARRGGRALRVWRFVRDSHPPASYAVLSSLWSLSLLFLLQRLHGELVFDAGMLAVSCSFFLILLFLRAIDEIKDLDYDRLHQPQRPLVRGDVSVTEVWTLAALTAATVILLNGWLAPALAWFVTAQMTYGLFLMALERASRTFRASILLNLIVTFPVSSALNVYACLYLVESGQTLRFELAVPAVLAYVAAFLHFEFGRKLKWPRFAAAGENGYAMALGVRDAAAVCLLLGALACALATWAHWQAGAGIFAWLPWIALLPSLAGMIRFFGKNEVHRELKSFFVLFLLLFFMSNGILALVA